MQSFNDRFDCHGERSSSLEGKPAREQFLLAGLHKSMLLEQSSLDLDDHVRFNGRPQGRILVVADADSGPREGARNRGEIALGTVQDHVLNMMPWFFRLDEEHDRELDDELKALLEECQTSVQAQAVLNGSSDDATVSMTIAYVLWPNLYVVHTGSGGCVLHRSTRLENVTAPDGGDGTRAISRFVWELDRQATRPRVFHATLEPGDTLVVASDGVIEGLSAEAMRRALAGSPDAETVASRLVTAASKAAPTEATAVVARLHDPRSAVTTGGPTGDLASRRRTLPLDPRESSARQFLAALTP